VSYEPRQFGARCDQCPLNGCSVVVPPETRSTATVAVIGDYPGLDDMRNERPFTGAVGGEFDQAIEQAGLTRRDLHITNALLCRPPDGRLENVVAKVQKENRKIVRENAQRAKNGEAQLPMKLFPVDCCRPRLMAEIRGFEKMLLVGGVAVRSALGLGASITDLRGGMIDGWIVETRDDRGLVHVRTLNRDDVQQVPGGARPVRAMPTLHPSFVMRARRWTHVFRSDLGRAVRWWAGALGWKPPKITYHPDPETLRRFLARPEPYFAYDLETDGIESLSAKIRCVGVGTANEVMIVGLLGKDGYTKFYPSADEVRVRGVLRDFFLNDAITKVGHNAGSYDRMVMESQEGYTPTPVLDTILLHRLSGESELPHNLGFVGSMYTDAPSWKCYDGATEVLTPGGWTRFAALQRGVPVAEWNAGVVRFVEPLAYVDQRHTGTAWRLTDQATDLLVTPDHKMIYRLKGSERLQACMVQDLPTTGSLPHTGMGADGYRWIEPDFIRLLVALQADGSWVKRADGWGLDFGFTKARKIERLTSLLSALGIAFTTKATGTKNPRTRIWVDPCEGTAQLRDLLGADKVFSADMLLLARELREVFLDELPLWDGTTGKAHTNYVTTAKANADIVQAVAVTTGRAARLLEYPNGEHRPIFRVSLPSGAVRSREWSKLDGLKREEVPYDGRIYCVSVPSGFLLVRRNGKVTVSGNTDREGNKLAWGAESDEQLHEYCAKDVAITAQVVPPLFQNVSLRSQDHLIATDHAIQSICAEMHTIGMPVDQEERGKKERKVHSEVFQFRDKLQTIVGNTSFNPGSNQQLQEILFDKWKLEPPCDVKDRYTGNGDPSTSDTVIRSLLMLPLHETHKEFLITLRNYRSAQKALGTYIVKLRTSDQYAEGGWDEDETSDEREARMRYGEKKVGIVDPRTGRMHPGYNAHVTTSGRLSSSRPINAQNFPAWLRTLVAAPAGRIFVGADADQLELRIAASRWDASLYLRAFDAGADPHASTALAVFGKEFREADGFPGGKWDADLFVLDGTGKWGGHAKKLRNLAKRVQYASQYGASVETVHRVLTETENDAGELIYLHLSVREVRQMHNSWLANAKEFPQGWERELAAWRRDGFLAEPVSGRRRWFLDGENLNEMVNFPIQGAGASLISKSMILLRERIKPNMWGAFTGINNQCHDSLMIETLPEHAEWVAKTLEECMNQTHPGLPGVTISATAAIGRTWKDV